MSFSPSKQWNPTEITWKKVNAQPVNWQKGTLCMENAQKEKSGELDDQRQRRQSLTIKLGHGWEKRVYQTKLTKESGDRKKRRLNKQPQCAVLCMWVILFQWVIKGRERGRERWKEREVQGGRERCREWALAKLSALLCNENHIWKAEICFTWQRVAHTRTNTEERVNTIKILSKCSNWADFPVS